MNLTALDAVAVALAVLVGFLLKRFVFKTDAAARQAIPLINLAIQFLGRVALEVAPAEAGVFGALAKAGESLLLESLFTTVLASGAQSSVKASGRVFLAVLKQLALRKAAEAATKEADKEVK